MGEVKSTRDLEDHIDVVSEQWNKISDGSLILRRVCSTCWRNEREHHEMTIGEGCQLIKLTPAEYFQELVGVIGALERVAIVYEKGLEDGIVASEMEAHVNSLKEDNERMSNEVMTLKEHVDYFAHQARQRREGDGNGWETSGWDSSDWR